MFVPLGTVLFGMIAEQKKGRPQQPVACALSLPALQ